MHYLIVTADLGILGDQQLQVCWREREMYPTCAVPRPLPGVEALKVKTLKDGVAHADLTSNCDLKYFAEIVEQELKEGAAA